MNSSATRILALATLWAWGSVGMTATPAGKPLAPPVLLPDGSQFTTWEVAPVFSKTYYVNPSHPKADDANPGTEDAPWKTVDRAAQALQPGQRVLIAAGVYRQRVIPARGGTGPERMIGYEAAPGARVVLKGSRLLEATWTQVGGDGKPDVSKVWKTRMPPQLFPGQNPFALVNLTDGEIDGGMPWAVPIKGKLPNLLRRGLVFQDGRRLVQVSTRETVAGKAGSYWVEPDGLGLCVRPFGDADPRKVPFEVTTLGTIFAPQKHGLGYIRVRGLTIEHCGNRFPRPQQGALSTMRGHHWIVEDNTVRQCNAIGIDIGDQFYVKGPGLAEGGRHIVRRNTITDCGIGGIEGKLIEHTLIEENTIRRCGWQDIWRVYEVAGIKVHCTRSCLLRRNLVTDTISAPGIWMDYANVNSRCTQNVIINTDCYNGGIFIEASQQPNLVDRNVVRNTRGNGIYQHDCDELVIANNLVDHSSEAAVMMRICQGRRVGGRPVTARRNKITGNVFVGNARQLSISDPDNDSDHNVFAAGPKPFDLAAWRKKTGWDEHSVAVPIQAELDPARLELKWSAGQPVPLVPRPAGLTHDFRGRAFRGDTIPPGPFGAIPTKPETISVDPHRAPGALRTQGP